MVSDLADVTTYAKFQDDIFRDYDFTGGRIFHFRIDFCMGTALPVMQQWGLLLKILPLRTWRTLNVFHLPTLGQKGKPQTHFS